MAPTIPAVVTVDCEYLEPEHAAAYLLIENGEAVFIDNNTVHAVPLLLDALAHYGLGPSAVRYVIPTHLHLDHGGGTSALVERCPNASVLAHPRAVRHLCEPERLIAGVKAVYGEAEFERLYAPILPIEASRVRGVEDGETLAFGERTFTFMQTRGHANHHICIHDSKSNGVFSGDTFGVNYKAKRPTVLPFILYSTAPTDFDPGEARRSIQRILDTGAQRVYLAHYGELQRVREGAEVLFASIDAMEAILNDAEASGLEGDALQRFCEARAERAFRESIEACGVTLEDGAEHQLAIDVRIGAQGLAYVAAKRRNSAKNGD